MKKGFTLIELLGTILILSAIVLVVAPLVINSVQDSKTKLEGTSEENIVMSAKNWANDNKDKLPSDGLDGSISVPILEGEGYLSDSDKNGCVIITSADGVYYYRYTEDKSICRNNALVDNTPPKITDLKVTGTTTNSITILVSATDGESKIAKYEFYINDGSEKWYSQDTDAETVTHTFTGLKDDTNYKHIKVRVTNALGKSSEDEISAKTLELKAPTLSQSGKNGVIDYKGQCGNGITCSYKKDSGSFTTVSGNTNVPFTDNGTLVARVSDGTNTETATLTMVVIIDASYSAGYYYCSSGYTLSGTSCKKTTTVNASYSPGYYYCSSGYTLSGSKCRKTTTTNATYNSGYYKCPFASSREGTGCWYDWVLVTGTIYCVGGVVDWGTDYQSLYDQCDSSTYNNNGDCAVTWDGQIHPTVYCRNYAGSATYVSGGYSCPSGYTLSGTKCTKTTTVSANYSSGYYYCSSGYTLSGTKCKKTTTVNASYSPGYYYCPSNYTLSGDKCIIN